MVVIGLLPDAGAGGSYGLHQITPGPGGAQGSITIGDLDLGITHVECERVNEDTYVGESEAFHNDNEIREPGPVRSTPG